MSRHYNCKHPDRVRSHYPERLIARGATSASVRMRKLDDLRRTQAAREDRTGSPWPTYTELAELDAA